MNTLNNSNVDINILVNGKPIKQHSFENKLFIEAKEETEYVIEIKNNRSTRILAIIGVDQVNVLNGEPNTSKSPGYVINGFDSFKLKGYRISNSEISSFKFCKPGEGYAKTKTISAQIGIITVECIAEKCFYTQLTDTWENNPWITPVPNVPWLSPNIPNYLSPTWYCGDVLYSQSNIKGTYGNVDDTYASCNNLFVQTDLSNITPLASHTNETTPSEHFDASTTWGKVQESKVIDASFTNGDNLGTISIYYAFADGLKGIGVPLSKNLQVVFPTGIHKNYCSPPPGWKS